MTTYDPDTDLVAAAKAYAREHHAGQIRKSTGKPFFTHLDRAAATLDDLGANDPVIAAAYLHDVVEDTGNGMDDYVTFDDVEDRFGDEVRHLVEGASEHTKDASWAERKRHTVEYLRDEAPYDVLLVTGADKLDNVRSLRRDLDRADEPYEAVWSNFSVSDKRKQAWYYGSIADILTDGLTDDTGQELARMYADVVDDVFGGTARIAPEP